MTPTTTRLRRTHHTQSHHHPEHHERNPDQAFGRAQRPVERLDMVLAISTATEPRSRTVPRQGRRTRRGSAQEEEVAQAHQRPRVVGTRVLDLEALDGGNSCVVSVPLALDCSRFGMAAKVALDTIIGLRSCPVASSFSQYPFVSRYAPGSDSHALSTDWRSCQGKLPPCTG